jgi:hypothetical protein
MKIFQNLFSFCSRYAILYKTHKVVIGVEISEKQDAGIVDNAAGVHNFYLRRLSDAKKFYKELFYGNSVYVPRRQILA